MGGSGGGRDLRRWGILELACDSPLPCDPRTNTHYIKRGP